MKKNHYIYEKIATLLHTFWKKYGKTSQTSKSRPAPGLAGLACSYGPVVSTIQSWLTSYQVPDPQRYSGFYSNFIITFFSFLYISSKRICFQFKLMVLHSKNQRSVWRCFDTDGSQETFHLQTRIIKVWAKTYEMVLEKCFIGYV